MSLLHPQLAAFMAVLDEGSFERAAQQLSLTPSAVSQRIKALEERLGQVLILRQAPCQATAAGQQLLRSVQQMRLLENETLDSFGMHSDEAAGGRIAVAVNADSLATWLLEPLAELHRQHGMLFDLHVEDQDHSTRLLREGIVLGAITADAHPVQGCHVEPLGTMRYLPIASPGLIERYFSGGLTASALNLAPMLVFNRKDDLQARFMRSVTRGHPAPPIHYIPSSNAFVEAAELGLGWAMAPESLLRERLTAGTLRVLAPRRWLDVPLYWQHWSLRAQTLLKLTQALHKAARSSLR